MNANDEGQGGPGPDGIRTWVRRSSVQGEIVVGVENLDRSLPGWVEDGPFRLVAIWPADRPSVAIVEGFGLHLRLDESAASHPLRIAVDERELDRALELDSVRFEPIADPRTQPIDDQLPDNRPTQHLSRGDEPFTAGRAGMLYQDLLPERNGGRFVVSRIRIEEDGPVPDSVHKHHVRAQMLVCTRGRVKVVYEDQGEPIWLEPGSAVLQPSGIRHRVLESEGGLEVLEVGCPAVHATEIVDDFALPNDQIDRARRWAGQRFAQVNESEGRYEDVSSGISCFHSEIRDASDGFCDLGFWKGEDDGAVCKIPLDAELTLLHVTDGSVVIAEDGRSGAAGAELRAGDSIVLPPGDPRELRTALRSSRWFVVRFGPLSTAGLA